MTFWEYELRMKAYALRRTDEEFMVYLQAWTIREAQAKKRAGKNGLKYIYRTMKEFFDYDARISEILDGKKAKKEKEQSSIANRLMEYERRKGDGEL